MSIQTMTQRALIVAAFVVASGCATEVRIRGYEPDTREPEEHEGRWPSERLPDDAPLSLVDDDVGEPVDDESDAGAEGVCPCPTRTIVCEGAGLRYELAVTGDEAVATCSADGGERSAEHSIDDADNYLCTVKLHRFRLYRVGAYGSDGVYVVRAALPNGVPVELPCD